MPYALHITHEETAAYRWVVVDLEGDTVVPFTHAECDFPDYESALNAGTLALAAADGEDYENEAADPVGNVDCRPSAVR